MKSSTVYYDEHSRFSFELAKKFAGRNPGVQILAAGEVADTIVYEQNEKVGFLFASVKGRLPVSIENLLRRIVVDKQAYIFAFVTGGNHEIRVILEMDEILRQRGMCLSSAYAEYMLQRFSSNEELQLQKMEEDIASEKCLLEEFHRQMEGASAKNVKRQMKRNLKKYIHDLKKKFQN